MNRAGVGVNRNSAVANVAAQEISLLELGKRVWARKWAIVLFAVGGLLIGVAISFLQSPAYRSTTLLEVHGLNENVLNTRDVDPNASSTEFTMEPYLESQLRILQSDALCGQVVDRLRLTREDSPAFKGGLFSRVFRTVRARPVASAFDRDAALRWVRANLETRIPGTTHLLEVSFASPDPELSAAVVNMLVAAFIERTIDIRGESTQRTDAWLKLQTAALKGQLERSEEALQKYAARNGLLFTSEKDSFAEIRLRELDSALSKAQEVRVAEQSRYELASKAPVESLPEVLDDETLRSDQIKLTDLRRERAELRPVLAPAHYRMQQIQSQIAELEASIERKRVEIVARIK